VLVAVACASLPRWAGAVAFALVVWLQLLGLGEQWWDPFAEDWRPATAQLTSTARPNDLVLIEGRWSQLPLDYYLAHTDTGAASASPRLEEHGVPLDFGQGGKPEPVVTAADMARVRALTAGQARVWLVSSHAFDVDPEGLTRKMLETELPCFDVWPYSGVSVALFTRC
jgi:hypothetical protein